MIRAEMPVSVGPNLWERHIVVEELSPGRIRGMVEKLWWWGDELLPPSLNLRRRRLKGTLEVSVDADGLASDECLGFGRLSLLRIRRGGLRGPMIDFYKNDGETRPSAMLYDRDEGRFVYGEIGEDGDFEEVAFGEVDVGFLNVLSDLENQVSNRWDSIIRWRKKGGWLRFLGAVGSGFVGGAITGAIESGLLIALIRHITE